MNFLESSSMYPPGGFLPQTPATPPEAGHKEAPDEWFPRVYAELRRLASSYLRGEKPGLTLQTTSLVHEAYIRLMGQHSAGWTDRQGFFATAATVMRRILVDHARARRAQKRGGESRRRVPLDDTLASLEKQSGSVIALGEALDQLAKVDARKASIVELRFILGLSVEETAVLLNLSARTVARDWNLARAWLLGELESASGAGEKN